MSTSGGGGGGTIITGGGTGGGQDVVSVGRIVMVVLTILCGLLALLLTCIAVATPNWQNVYLREIQSEHFHGLWLDCILRRYSQMAVAENVQCTYKFENADLIPPNYSESTVQSEDNQHKFQDWHKAVLTFFAASIICGVMAICFTLCAACVRICAIVANVLQLCAFVSALTGVSVFFINSHRIDIRFVHGITMTHEQFKGYSFYLSVFGVLCFAMTFAAGIIATILIFLHDRNQHRRQKRKTFPTETTVTAITV